MERQLQAPAHTMSHSLSNGVGKESQLYDFPTPPTFKERFMEHITIWGIVYLTVGALVITEVLILPFIS